MTKQEIKDLVAAKIAGQGSQVDIGGALADILSGIVDAIPEGGGDNPIILEGQNDDSIMYLSNSPYTVAEICQLVLQGKKVFVHDTVSNYYYSVTNIGTGNNETFPILIGLNNDNSLYYLGVAIE